MGKPHEKNRINITRSEFLESYRKHYALDLHGDPDVSPRTRRLVLFYSVECGLKSFIMKSIGEDTYEGLKAYSETNRLYIHGHDVKAMLKLVGIDHRYPIKRIRLSGKGGDVPSRQFNELWRYGASVESEEEEMRAEKVLRDIAEWIKKRL